MSLFVFFISLLIVAQHFSGNHVPIIRSWRLRDVIASCWYVPWLWEGCQVRLAGSASIGRTTCQPVLTTFPQPRHIPTQGYNITQSSTPDDGYTVARNMFSNYQKRNKEYKKWHLVGFSYPHWITMHVQPHIRIETFLTVRRTEQYITNIRRPSRKITVRFVKLQWNLNFRDRF